MTVKVTMANGGSDSVDFINNAGTTLAQVKGIDGGSSNGSLALHTTASGTSTERVRVDNAGNVGIGTSSPAGKLSVVSAGDRALQVTSGTDTPAVFNGTGNNAYIQIQGSSSVYLGSVSGAYTVTTNGAERARIDTSGNLLVGGTSTDPTLDRVNETGLMGGANAGRIFSRGSGHSMGLSGTSGTQIQWWTDNGSARVAAGTISSSGSTTAYNTSSDYRLKENIASMTGALNKVASLNPVTFTWKADGKSTEGFIAHELQAVVPDCVTGEKDAVDEDGNPIYQGIDTSFLVATLTAAIQELKTIVDTQAAKITALENK